MSWTWGNEFIVMEEQIVVSILCTAYNHESYIRQCLDGFVMQKTNFKFEAIVHDDASTDNTASVIREYAEKYPDIIVPIYQIENQFRKTNIYSTYLYPKSRGKYIAICEGDDYWTDPYKLQKQVDFLEANPDCSFCCSGFVHKRKGEYDVLEVLSREDKPFFKFELNDFLTENWFTVPLTTMYRKREFLEEIKDFLPKYKYYRDVHMYYHLLLIGKGLYISECMGCYRYHFGGISSMQSKHVQIRDGYNIWRELYAVHKHPILRKLSYIYAMQCYLSIDDTVSKLSLLKYAWSISDSFGEKKIIIIKYVKYCVYKIKQFICGS